MFLVEAEWKDSESYYELDLPAFAFRELGEDTTDDLSPYGQEERPESDAPEQFLQLLGTVAEGVATRETERDQLYQQVPQMQAAVGDLQAAIEQPAAEPVEAEPPPGL